MISLTTDEQETSYIVEANNRKSVRIFSNDPVMQKRFDKMGIKHYKTDGQGYFYKVDLSEFSFGIRRKRQMSDEQRAAIAERFAALRNVDDDDDE